MGKRLSMMMVALLATLGMQAQTIKKGDAFFDGNSLYTVQEGIQSASAVCPQRRYVFPGCSQKER